MTITTNLPEKELEAAYRQGRLNQYLAGAGPDFSAVIEEGNRLILMTDHFAIRPLFLYQKGNQIAWANQLTDLLNLPLSLDHQAVQGFWEKGRFEQDRTWFEEVRFIPPATILIADRQTGQVREERYWSWENIRPVKCTLAAAAEEACRLLKIAVAQKLRPDGSTGIALSGGLDSRALLASMPPDYPVRLATFGMPGSWDVEIARSISLRLGLPHRVFELNSQNWMDGREEGVWRTGGMKNMLHLHFTSQQAAMAAWYPANLNGFLGGVLINGVYVGKKVPEGELIWNRSARFSILGVQEWRATQDQQLPFANHDLVAFILGLPAEYRRYGRLYRAMGKHGFPAWFLDTPWQNTGVPLRQSTLTTFLLRSRFRKIQRRMGWLKNYLYTDYPHWVRQEKAQTLLRDSNAPFRRWAGPAFDPLRADPEQVGRALTIQLWLDRINRTYAGNPLF